MKYFFLSEGWFVERVWELGGLWNAASRRRQPQIELLPLSILEQGERLQLYRVEPDVLMVEVKPGLTVQAPGSVGQVVLKRLITADQAIDLLAKSSDHCLIPGDDDDPS